jgi:protein TonB
VHAAALMLLLAPVTPPGMEKPADEATRVVIIEPPPPSPPSPSPDIGASVDISSKNMNPPQYPVAALRECVGGEVVVVVDVDASGNVTNVAVEKSSRNRELDRSATDAAHNWRFNPSVRNGTKAAGRVRVPINFKSPC